MRHAIKNLFLDLHATVYVLFIICFFAMTGSVIIYLLPAEYFLIETKPLFQWLYFNQRWHTFWLYACVVLFGFTAITGLICVWKDAVNKRFVICLLHIGFILMLLAHLISSFTGYKVPNTPLPQEKVQTIPLAPPLQPIRLFLRSIVFDTAPGNIPYNIRASITYFEGKQRKDAQLSVNNPIIIDGAHLIMKDVQPYLNSVTIKMLSGNTEELFTIPIDAPYAGDGYSLEYIASNPDFSQMKLLYEEKGEKQVLLIGYGMPLVLKNKKHTVTGIIPSIVPAVVLDVAYDPSLMLMFYASTVFTALLIVQAFKRIFQRRTAS